MNEPYEPQIISLGELIADSPDQAADLDDCLRVTAEFCDYHGCHMPDGNQTADLWGYGEIPIAFIADEPEEDYVPFSTSRYWVSLHHLAGPTGLTVNQLIELWAFDRYDRVDVDELKFHIPSQNRDMAQPLASDTFALRVFSEHSPHREEFRAHMADVLAAAFTNPEEN